MIAEVLERAKAVGFLGPGPVDDHIAHAEVFGAALEALSPDPGHRWHYGDIGAGGGVPSLPMLVDHPLWTATLLDSAQRRCSFLSWAAAELGLADRVTVECGRVEELAHRPDLRFGFDAVVARGFGPPAATVECGVGLLSSGGYLVVSEPPVRRSWPVEPLMELGLVEQEPVAEGVVVLQRLADLPDEFPRRAKVMKSRPLFGDID